MSSATILHKYFNFRFIPILGVLFAASIVPLIAGATGGHDDGCNDHDGGGHKISICHIPSGNESNPQTITIDKDALSAHFEHGDSKGECDDGPPPPPPEDPKGSLNVCKLIADQNGVISDGSGTEGEFSISGIDPLIRGNQEEPAGVFATTTWSTPLTLNADVLGNDNVIDARCVFYDNLPLGSYYYGEETISGEDWLVPLYTDQFSSVAEDTSDFYAYSGELFTETGSDDGSRNTNADGHIILSEERPNRTLLVLNTIKREVLPPPPSYASYCGDGIVNQEWEQCDGEALCTEFCSLAEDTQCRDIAFARVRVTNVENFGNGNASSVIFLGSSSNMIPEGTWFPIYATGAFLTDPDIAFYEDVEGIAVQRQDGAIRALLHGSHNPNPNEIHKEHVEGFIEFSHMSAQTQTSDTSGNNRLENGSNGVKKVQPGEDEVWIDGGKSYFWLTVTTADDGFFTNLTEPNICPLTPPQCSDGEDNDQDGFTDADDSQCHTDGNPGNEESYDPDIDNESDILPVFTCSDSVDNDEDGKTDGADPACHTDGDPENEESYDPELDSENSRPVITLVGSATTTITVGDSFTDPGATAADAEDGDITSSIVASSTVATSTPGTYAITYNVSDSDGLAADPVTRTVIVEEEEGGGGGEEPVSTPVSAFTGGGGGGGIPTLFGTTGGGAVTAPDTLIIFNERVSSAAPGVALITWNTNLPAGSRVVYDTASHAALGSLPNYGYVFSTVDVSIASTTHAVAVTGLNPASAYYFRPVSASSSGPKVGAELAIIPGLTGEEACAPYLDSYLRLGDANNPAEVAKLQLFLRDYEGFSDLQVTGVFDQATFDAVSAFQARYTQDILGPWGIIDSTGYVYITTRNKINELYCRSKFEITPEEAAIIAQFRERFESGGIGPEEATGLVGQAGEDNESGFAAGKRPSGEGFLANLARGAQNFAGAFLAVPRNLTEFLRCLTLVVFVLLIILLAWVLFKEGAYEEKMPTERKLEQHRIIFFSVGIAIALLVLFLTNFPCALTPLFILLVALLVRFGFIVRKR